MANRAIVFISLLGLGAALVVVWTCPGGQSSPPAPIQSVPNRSDPPAYAAGGRHIIRPYGKIAPPADVCVGCIESCDVAGEVIIVASASSLVPVHSVVLTLLVPQIGSEPGRQEVLWTGTLPASTTQTVEYPLGVLPTGQYCLSAILEFQPAGDNPQEMALSDSLYLDVRPTGILSSNVSFEHIQRLELRRELERRIVMSMKPRFTIASDEDIADELLRLEAIEPGFVDRKIAELEATDPDVARRIMELSVRQADFTETAGNN